MEDNNSPFLSSPLHSPLPGLASSCFFFQAQSPWSLLQEPSQAPTRPGTSPLCSKASHMWVDPGPDHVRVCAQSLSGVQLCNPMDCNLPGSSVHGISQARTLEWVAISSSRGSSQPSGCVSCVSCISKQTLYHWATWEAPEWVSFTAL